jgi:hypothetical protein
MSWNDGTASDTSSSPTHKTRHGSYRFQPTNLLKLALAILGCLSSQNKCSTYLLTTQVLGLGPWAGFVAELKVVVELKHGIECLDLACA